MLLTLLGRVFYIIIFIYQEYILYVLFYVLFRLYNYVFPFNPITLIPLYTVVRLRDVDSGTVEILNPKPLAIWILMC